MFGQPRLFKLCCKASVPRMGLPMVPKTPGITIPTMDQQGVRSRDIGVFLEIWGTSQNHSKLVSLP